MGTSIFRARCARTTSLSALSPRRGPTTLHTASPLCIELFHRLHCRLPHRRLSQVSPSLLPIISSVSSCLVAANPAFKASAVCQHGFTALPPAPSSRRCYAASRCQFHRVVLHGGTGNVRLYSRLLRSIDGSSIDPSLSKEPNRAPCISPTGLPSRHCDLVGL